jgi:hypothetical protein
MLSYLRQAANEPWLLASSLTEEKGYSGQWIVNLYKLRMQIEEGFRDLKSARDGFGMENALVRLGES